ncbi:MAG TPA: helical backbone metal receptor [Chitinophagaceae bacterium]
MPLHTDQLHRSIRLDNPPQRIVSLVPSQTELLYDLGLDDRVAGITKFCVHPNQWFTSKTRVGGTKTVKMEIIDRLQPDLIIANKEENVQEQVEELALRYPVWTSDINNLEDAFRMMAGIGQLTGRPTEAAAIIHTAKSRFLQLPVPRIRRRAAYLIWQNPWMTIGGDTFINDMLQRCGWDNVFADRRRYPVVTPEELAAAGCQLVLLSSEPYPFKEKHVHEWEQRLPGAKVVLADGEMFSWYGSRLLHAPEYFMQLQKQQ